ncbi:MAG: diguanylate cyclase [Clostridia bacterium]|nr:diguanylate cyclase [Clostridia bacterium]
MSDIYIIDCNDNLINRLRQIFESKPKYNFIHIDPENLEVLSETSQDMIIINEESINTDVIELCKKTQENKESQGTPVVVISCDENESHKIKLLELGVNKFIPNTASDEYLYFDIKNAINLVLAHRECSPLTGLPGNHQIEKKLSEKLKNGETFQVLYFDLDNFKAYNDIYGYLDGDEIIKLTANIIQNHIKPLNKSFIGHVGGDDFVAIINGNSNAEEICEKIIDEFDEEVLKYFHDIDVKRGYLEEKNRKGKTERFPLTSISIGVVKANNNRFEKIQEIAETGAQVKNLAKRKAGSAYVINRRRGELKSKYLKKIVEDLKQKGTICNLHLKDVTKVIKESGREPLLISNINNIQTDIIYKSDMHGQAHTERVLMLALSMGILEGLKERDLQMLLETAKYHDIGRKNDEEDELHGARSAEMLESKDILQGYSQKEKNIIKMICACHSIDDKQIDEYVKRLPEEDRERCKKMLIILKDADALDRVRLKEGEGQLETRFLRTNTSKAMISAAYELYNNHKKNRQLLKKMQHVNR